MLFSAKEIIEDCYFINNRLDKNKCGIGMSFDGTDFNVEFTNCLFEENQAGKAGGAFQFDNDGSLEFDSCAFKGNKAPFGCALTFNSRKSHTNHECKSIGNKTYRRK